MAEESIIDHPHAHMKHIAKLFDKTLNKFHSWNTGGSLMGDHDLLEHMRPMQPIPDVHRVTIAKIAQRDKTGPVPNSGTHQQQHGLFDSSRKDSGQGALRLQRQEATQFIPLSGVDIQRQNKGPSPPTSGIQLQRQNKIRLPQHDAVQLQRQNKIRLHGRGTGPNGGGEKPVNEEHGGAHRHSKQGPSGLNGQSEGSNGGEGFDSVQSTGSPSQRTRGRLSGTIKIQNPHPSQPPGLITNADADRVRAINYHVQRIKEMPWKIRRTQRIPVPPHDHYQYFPPPSPHQQDQQEHRHEIIRDRLSIDRSDNQRDNVGPTNSNSPCKENTSQRWSDIVRKGMSQSYKKKGASLK